MKSLLFASLLCLAAASASAAEPQPPVRLAIIGLVHDHVGGMIPSLAGRRDVQLVGIVEPDQSLAASYAARFHLDRGLFFRPWTRFGRPQRSMPWRRSPRRTTTAAS